MVKMLGVRSQAEQQRGRPDLCGIESLKLVLSSVKRDGDTLNVVPIVFAKS